MYVYSGVGLPGSGQSTSQRHFSNYCFLFSSQHHVLQTDYISWFAIFLLPSLLIQYILNSVLPNMRVSAQSLGLACVTAAVDISPLILPTLEPLEMFALADDPKLRCRFIKVSGYLITIKH